MSTETDTGTPGPTSQAYSYDQASRVTADASSSYSYDPASELTTGPGGAAQAYDSAGELCWSAPSPPTGSTCSSRPSGATSYSYDSLGDRTETTAPSSTSSYSWDQSGELTATATTGASVNYAYDAQGLIASRTGGGQSANFVWDPVEDPSDPLLVDDGTNYYIYGPDELPTEQISVASGTPDYYLHDGLGSTRLLTSSTGTVDRSYTYNAWGQTVATGGSGGLTSTSATIVPIGNMALTQSSSTLSVSPVQAGDLTVLSVIVPGSTPQVAGVSGGGVSSWSKAVAYQDTTGGYDDEIWWGVVSSPGPSTATVSWADGAPSWDDLAAQDFSGGAGATWSVDTSGGDVGSGWTVPFASLTPSTSSGELYFGQAATSGYAQPEDTPGYTYLETTGGEAVYDTDVTSTSAPYMGQYPDSGASLTASALFIASGGEGTVPITDVGNIGTYSGYVGSSSTTLAVSPETVGDVEVLGVVNDTWATTVSSVSGGGVTDWQPASTVYYDGGDAQMLQYFYGTVTSAGSSTVTVDWSGAINDAQLADEELSAGPGATWSVNAYGSSTSPFPSLSAPVSDEAYVGMAFAWGDAASGGTSGVNYHVVSSDFMTAVDTSFSGTLSPDGTGAGSLAVLVTASAPSGPTTPLLWAGQYQDPATGLYYMRARWYDPATGQFLSVDPDLAETGEPYAYAGDDPVNEADPSGDDPCPPGISNGSYRWVPYAPFDSSSQGSSPQPAPLQSAESADASPTLDGLFDASNCPAGTQGYKGDETPFNCLLGVPDLIGHKVLIRMGTTRTGLYPRIGAFGLLHMEQKHGLGIDAAQWVIGHEYGGENDGRYYYKMDLQADTGLVALIAIVVESRGTETPPDHNEVGVITGGCEPPGTPKDSLMVADCPSDINQILPEF